MSNGDHSLHLLVSGDVPSVDLPVYVPKSHIFMQKGFLNTYKALEIKDPLTVPVWYSDQDSASLLKKNPISQE